MGIRRNASSCSNDWVTSENLCIWNTVCIDGRQFFRQYNTIFNQYTFLEYLKELQSKFHKVILFLDRAPQHYCRSIKVRKYLEKNKDDDIRVGWFPKGSPEFNAVEECWRQGKGDLLVSKYYPRFLHLRNVITKYYRTKRFHPSKHYQISVEKCELAN